MEALASSYSLRILANKCSNKNLQSKTFLGRSDFRFSQSLNCIVHLNQSFSVRKKAIHLVASSYLSPDTKVLTDLDTADTTVQTIQPPNTVNVKFQLQKECMFGDQFLLVGDDPVVGSWNPADAKPMNWSDGHIWTVELDIPIELSIQFKFLLKESTGNVLWQPGQDRILRTWGTKNIIVVAEDWENAEVQKITEEQMINVNEGSVTNQDLKPNVAGNVSHQSEEFIPILNEDTIDSDNLFTCAEDEQMFNSNNEYISDKRIIYSEDELLRNVETPTLVSAEDKENLVTDEGPVLLPGLAPSQVMSTEAAFYQEFGKAIITDARIGVDAAKDHNMPELTS